MKYSYQQRENVSLCTSFVLNFIQQRFNWDFFFYLDLNLTMHTQRNNTRFMENINETETLEMEADTCKKF